MKEIIVWGMDSAGNYSVLLPVIGQLQSNWSWNGDTKIFHLIGGGVAAYSAGIKTRGSGSLVLELKGRSALEQLMECVKYGSFAVAGGQFGGIRYQNEAEIFGAESLYQGKICYISGAVTTSVIQESSEWFKVTIPVEIGESSGSFPSFYPVRDSFDEHSPPGANQSVSLYKGETENYIGLGGGTVLSTAFSKPGNYLIRETQRRLPPVSVRTYGYLNDHNIYEIAAHFRLWQSAAADTLGGSAELDHVYENGTEVVYSLSDERWRLSCPLPYNEHTFVISLMVGGCVLRDTYVLPVVNPEVLP